MNSFFPPLKSVVKVGGLESDIIAYFLQLTLSFELRVKEPENQA